MQCECENKIHFTNGMSHADKIGHSYLSVSATETIHTEYGPFNVCEECKDKCMKDYIIHKKEN